MEGYTLVWGAANEAAGPKGAKAGQGSRIREAIHQICRNDTAKLPPPAIWSMISSMMNAASKPWFRRKKIGFGYAPQTWQGWASIVAFLGLLGASVSFAQTLGADEAAGRNGAFVVAAVEIMGFMIFVRRNADKK